MGGSSVMAPFSTAKNWLGVNEVKQPVASRTEHGAEDGF
jgi:hypothetical protein